MGTMAVVMIHEDGNRSFEMPTIQDEQAVETFISDGASETLSDGIRLRGQRRRSDDSIPSVRNTSSKLAVNF
jgi:hypothetical protein